MNQPQPQSPKTAVWAALVTAGVHAFLLLAVMQWLRSMVPICNNTYVTAQMKIPTVTEYVVQIGMWIVENHRLFSGLIIAFLMVDITLLWALSGPKSYRVLREIWNGIIVIVLLASLFVTRQRHWTIAGFPGFCLATTR